MGRPKLPDNLRKVPILIYVPPWLAEWMKSQNNTPGRLVEEAFDEALKVREINEIRRCKKRANGSVHPVLGTGEE